MEIKNICPFCKKKTLVVVEEISGANYYSILDNGEINSKKEFIGESEKPYVFCSSCGKDINTLVVDEYFEFIEEVDQLTI